MNNSAKYQYSDNTPEKQKAWRSVVALHTSLACNIIAKQQRASHYIYYDLHAGPGIDPTGQPGSPLIFIEETARKGLSPICHLYEIDPETCHSLKRAVDGRTNVFVYNQSHDTILAGVPKYKAPLGLAYADPSNAVIPVDALRVLNRAYYRVDACINIAAASFKRSVERDGYEDIAEKLSKIGKKHWLIHEPYGKHQWTMFLGTNWHKFPDWKKRGWVSWNKQVGRKWWEQVVLTKRQLEEKYQMRLFE